MGDFFNAMAWSLVSFICIFITAICTSVHSILIISDLEKKEIKKLARYKIVYYFELIVFSFLAFRFSTVDTSIFISLFYIITRFLIGAFMPHSLDSYRAQSNIDTQNEE